MMSTTRYSVHPSVRIQEVGDELVLLHLDSGEYFGLDSVGRRFLEHLRNTGDIDATVSELAREFDAEPETLRRDLLKLVEQFREQGLVEPESDR